MKGTKLCRGSQLIFLPNFRDGRFQIGDELVNVNGVSLQGITMREVTHILNTSGPQVDIIIARDQHTTQRLNRSISLRRRQAKHKIQRPQSITMHSHVVTERTIMPAGDITKTIITIPNEGQDQGSQFVKDQSKQIEHSKAEKSLKPSKMNASAVKTANIFPPARFIPVSMSAIYSL